MRWSITLLTLVMSFACLAALTISAPPLDNPALPTEVEIDRLVEQLGSSSFEERTSASKKLDALGAAALPGLRRSLKGGDAETQRRAAELIAAIEGRATSATVLSATKVRLKAEGKALSEVVRDLSLQSGVALCLDREPAELGDRPVTLDTGETSFWEALDTLCRRAKLHLQAEPRVVPAEDKPDAKESRKLPADQSIQLVLQDGTLPEQAVAYLGCLRLRFLRDRFYDVGKGTGNDRWVVEILSEPKVRWQGLLFLDWEVARTSNGERLAAFPRLDDIAKAQGPPTPQAAGGGLDAILNGILQQVAGAATKFGKVNQNPGQEVMRREIPVRWVLPADAAGKPVTLGGKLRGQAMSPPREVVTVADVVKADGKKVKGKDGYELAVKSCGRKKDGTVEMELELETSAPAGAAGLPQMPVQLVGALPPEGESVGIHLWDTKGRKYTIAGVKETLANNIITLTMTLKPPAKDSVPERLERHVPYLIGIEQKFELSKVQP